MEKEKEEYERNNVTIKKKEYERKIQEMAKQTIMELKNLDPYNSMNGNDNVNIYEFS